MDIRVLIEVAGTILAGLGGAGLIIMAFASWLGKVWANRILEEDRLKYSRELEQIRSDLEKQHRLLQGNLDKAIHVHRVQFETEFRALSDIWEKLSQVRSRMEGLRPFFDIVGSDEDPTVRFSCRFRAFQDAFIAFGRAVHDQSPFYPKEIYEELFEAVNVARREQTSVAVYQPEYEFWFKDGEANFKALAKSAERVSEMIRARIATLQVH